MTIFYGHNQLFYLTLHSNHVKASFLLELDMMLSPNPFQEFVLEYVESSPIKKNIATVYIIWLYLWDSIQALEEMLQIPADVLKWFVLGAQS